MPFGGRIILAQETLCEGGPDPLTGRGHIPALYKVQGLCIGRYVASMLPFAELLWTLVVT